MDNLIEDKFGPASEVSDGVRYSLVAGAEIDGQQLYELTFSDAESETVLGKLIINLPEDDAMDLFDDVSDHMDRHGSTWYEAYAEVKGKLEEKQREVGVPPIDRKATSSAAMAVISDAPVDRSYKDSFSLNDVGVYVSWIDKNEGYELVVTQAFIPGRSKGSKINFPIGKDRGEAESMFSYACQMAEDLNKRGYLNAGELKEIVGIKMEAGGEV